MSRSSTCLPPSTSLPKLRSLHSLAAPQLLEALHSLRAIYCPLRLPVGWSENIVASSAVVDSGYASEDDGIQLHYEEALSALRADIFERDYAVRWLTRLISYAETLSCGEEAVSTIVDEAGFILASFSDVVDNEDEEALSREFSFEVANLSGLAQTITVRLKDAPLSGTDHTDVGLQSWGASIIFSGLLCADPRRFGLLSLPPDANIVELGAGTGLVSLTIGRLLPCLGVTALSILATDYHPAVLENLRTNVAMNMTLPDGDGTIIQTALLDWKTRPSSLHSSTNMMVAADVIYAPEHAASLRDCAAELLAPDGVFWLIATVRTNGKFEGISDTVEAAFQMQGNQQPRGRRSLQILEMEQLQKKRGIGRGDENGYMLFKIGWSLA